MPRTVSSEEAEIYLYGIALVILFVIFIISYLYSYFTNKCPGGSNKDYTGSMSITGCYCLPGFVWDGNKCSCPPGKTHSSWYNTCT